MEIYGDHPPERGAGGRQRMRGVQPVVRGGTEHEGERTLPRHFTAPQAVQAGSFGSDSVFTRIVSASLSARRPAASSPKRTSSRNTSRAPQLPITPARKTAVTGKREQVRVVL